MWNGNENDYVNTADDDEDNDNVDENNFGFDDEVFISRRSLTLTKNFCTWT